MAKMEESIRAVCASNLIFFRSKREGGVDCPKDACECWSIHELILQVVKPKLIVAFGNGEGGSTYSYLRNKFCEKKKHGEKTQCSDHSNWKVKSFQGWLKAGSADINHDMWVAGLPHLSRYAICTGNNEDIH